MPYKFIPLLIFGLYWFGFWLSKEEAKDFTNDTGSYHDNNLWCHQWWQHVGNMVTLRFFIDMERLMQNSYNFIAYVHRVALKVMQYPIHIEFKNFISHL